VGIEFQFARFGVVAGLNALQGLFRALHGAAEEYNDEFALGGGLNVDLLISLVCYCFHTYGPP
jgi:hypothetical protein